MPSNGISGLYSSSIFSFFRETPYCPLVVVPMYIPTNSVGGFPFYAPFPAFIVCRFFDDGLSDRCEVILQCSFDLRFSNN